jgi:DNA-binding NtrC family response regulator
MMNTALPDIIGESPAIRRLKSLIARVATADIAVLIEGPTGAGKELVAQALHQLSGRPGAFVAFNVCAIADTMFEDEIFGHVRGAFTGATGDKPGYLMEAHRGTVFLDEVGSLPLSFQSKLLRALETRQFRPVGARRDQMSDFRVVSATNETLDGLVRTGRFRRDLAQRLSGMIISVPPLSDRREDIPFLAQHFASRFSRNTKAGLTRGAIAALQRYSWPGNVRELRQVVERALVLSGQPTLNRSQIVEAIGSVQAARAARSSDSVDRRRLLAVLQRAGWDTTVAAGLLGVHRGTIYRRMQRLGVPLRSRVYAGDLNGYERVPNGLQSRNGESANGAIS